MELLLFVAVICIVFAYLTSKRTGELGVSRKIESLIKRNSGYSLFNNVILETLDGSTQIDHVLVSPYGVFVIETKNLSGWIFGDPYQKRWTQSLRRGRKYQFQNPIHQNYKHVKAVQKFLDIDPHSVFSVVVFTGNSTFMTAMPDNVMRLGELIPYIKSYKDPIINSDQLDRFCQIFIAHTEHASITHEDHMRNIERNMAHPICPKCGILMVLRTARAGASMGSEFWGCSNWPSCKITKNVI